MVFSTRGRCNDDPHSFLARTKSMVVLKGDATLPDCVKQTTMFRIASWPGQKTGLYRRACLIAKADRLQT